MKLNIFPDTEKIDFSKKLRVKFGIDPTSDKLHLGHLIPLLLVKKLWEEGHSVDIVLGTFTAQLGDPSGKDTMRPILTSEETEANANSITEQLARIFGNPDASHPSFKNIQIHRNGDWFGCMNAIMMTNILSKFTTTQLLARDSFQKRMKENNPIGMHELVVPILQGYDSVFLQSDVEIGGTDQLFNFGISRDMQRLKGQEPEKCILTPIIDGTDGRKMSKSFGNCIFINDTLQDVYGKVMSISDNLMLDWWSLFIEAPIEIKQPMKSKHLLAWTITSLIWGVDGADTAQRHFKQVIQDKKIPNDVVEFLVEPKVFTNEKMKINLLEVISHVRKCSKTEAKRLVNSGAIRTITEDGIENSLFIDSEVRVIPGTILKVGKRDFVKLV
jgi:tyrosyl-tRNA synthetase